MSPKMLFLQNNTNQMIFFFLVIYIKRFHVRLDPFVHCPQIRKGLYPKCYQAALSNPFLKKEIKNNGPFFKNAVKLLKVCCLLPFLQENPNLPLYDFSKITPHHK